MKSKLGGGRAFSLFGAVGIFFSFSLLQSLEGVPSCRSVVGKLGSASPTQEVKESPLQPGQVENVVEAVRSTFTQLRDDPEVLPKRWRLENEAGKVPSVGFCFAAANAVFFMLGGKRVGLTSMVASYIDESGLKATHWWLRDADGLLIDPTADQYTAYGEEPPYEKGRGCGFCRSNDSPTIAGKKIIRLATKWLRDRGFKKNGLALDRP